MISIGSLFSGIEGIGLGLEWSGGFRLSWQVELDPFCTKVLERHWPEVERFGDIRGLDDFPKADIITAGFPCQDISVAGKGAGLSGARSGLWAEAMRAVRLVRPKYVLLENVAALRNRGLSVILGALAEGGYDSEWDCLPASSFGAPHQRDRLFLVAYPDSVHLPQQRGWRSWPGGQGETEPGDSGEAGQASDTHGIGPLRRTVLSSASFETRRFRPEGDNPWSAGPPFCGMAPRIPDRSHRLKALGNAVVPQIAELLAECILKAEAIA